MHFSLFSFSLFFSTSIRRLRLRCPCLVFQIALQLLLPTHLAANLLLTTALNRAYESDVSQTISASEIAVHQANRVQCGKLKNPEVNILVEDFYGSGIYGGWRSAQVTYAITQEFDLWQKRQGKVALARYEELIATYDAIIARQVIRKELVDRFFSAYALQEKMRLAQEKWHMTKEEFQRLEQNVTEGKLAASVLPVEELRLMRAELEFEAAQRATEHAFHQLALRMGAQQPDFEALEYTFYELVEPSPKTIPISAQLEAHPLIARARAAVEASQQRIVVEKREPLPNPQVLVGVQQSPRPRFNKHDYSFAAGVTFPLTIWDRNQGGICAAKWQLEGDIARLEQAKQQLYRELTERHQELMQAYIDAKMHREKLLAKAEEQYQVSRDSFHEGLLSLTEWIQATQDWFAVREESIDSLLRYHQKREAFESLVECMQYLNAHSHNAKPKLI